MKLTQKIFAISLTLLVNTISISLHTMEKEQQSDNGTLGNTIIIRNTHNEEICTVEKDVLKQANYFKATLENYKLNNLALPVPKEQSKSFIDLIRFLKFSHDIKKGNKKIADLHVALKDHSDAALVDLAQTADFFDAEVVRDTAVAMLISRWNTEDRIKQCVDEGSFCPTLDNLTIKQKIGSTLLRNHPAKAYMLLQDQIINEGDCKLPPCTKFKFPTTVNQMTFSPISNHCAILNSISHEVYILDGKTGEYKFSFNLGKQLYAIAFSPKNKDILACSSYDGVYLWNLKIGTLNEVIKIYDQSERITHLVFSHDGRILACGFSKGIILYDTQNPQLLEKEDEHVNCLTFHPNDSYLIVGVRRYLRVYNRDSKTWKYCAKDEHRGIIRCVAVNSQGIIASASADETLKLWAISGNTITCIKTLYIGYEHESGTLAFNSEGTLLIASIESAIQIWDVGTGKCIFENSKKNCVSKCCSLSPDDCRIISASLFESDDGNIWKIADEKTKKYLDDAITTEESALIIEFYNSKINNQLFVLPKKARAIVNFLPQRLQNVIAPNKRYLHAISQLKNSEKIILNLRSSNLIYFSLGCLIGAPLGIVVGQVLIYSIKKTTDYYKSISIHRADPSNLHRLRKNIIFYGINNCLIALIQKFNLFIKASLAKKA